MSFPPQSPFFPQHRQTTPPSDSTASTANIPTPASAAWSNRGGMWSHQGREPIRMGGIMAPHTAPMPGRRALADLSSNQMPALGLASPFVPSDQNAVWGPPGFNNSDAEQTFTLQKELAAAHARIRELTLENDQLRRREAMRAQRAYATPAPQPISPVEFMTPAESTASSVYYDSGTGTSPFGFGNLSLGTGGYMDDDGTVASQSGSDQVYSLHAQQLVSYPPELNVQDPASYRAPRYLQHSLLRGVYNFADMKESEIRPVVWVIAHIQPTSSLESASLKAAVSNLANRFALGTGHPSSTLLITAIFDWAKNLCYTSCGNYLCQQLLERADLADRQKFIEIIKPDLVDIASDKFGTHVLCKAVGIKELEGTIAEALLDYGVFDSLKTGARRLWRELGHFPSASHVLVPSVTLKLISRINDEVKGRWAELACVNEASCLVFAFSPIGLTMQHGSIAVQQVFEVFGSQDLTVSLFEVTRTMAKAHLGKDPCFDEIIADIATVANNQYGHFVITKLLGYPHLVRATCEAIISSHPPVATTHHGVNFVKSALAETARAGLSKYIDAICGHEEGHTPGLVAIATASVGKAHLIFLLSYLNPSEQNKIRAVCKAYSTTLRNSQSGNDLLRSLGIIHAVGSRYRAGST